METVRGKFRAISSFLSSVEVIITLAALIWLTVLAYLSLSGNLVPVILWVFKMVSAILLSVFAVYYMVDGLDEGSHEEEDLAAGMSIKDYLLKKHRNGGLPAGRIFESIVPTHGVDLAWEMAFKERALGLGILHCCFIVLILGYTIAGFEPRLGIVAALMASIGAMKKIGHARELDTFKMQMTWNLRDKLLHVLVYCMPVVYVMIVLFTGIF